MENLRQRLDELKAAARLPLSQVRGPRPAAPTRNLPEIAPGIERHSGGTPFWEVETAFQEACERHGVELPKRVTTLQSRPAIAQIAQLDPGRTILIDIETGGFSGTEVFLIGLVPLDGRPLRVIQWLARDYPEEAGILAALAELAGRRDAWVTFNGKSFDEPFLRDRAAVHRVRLSRPRVHVDLLHHARRQWGPWLPNCRLQTLEQHLLGWRRIGDVPSSDIPDLFHHFIRTGNADLIRPVLEHNQLDLISCTELLLHLT